MLSNILSMVTVWNQISKQGRFRRKKYVGVCRRGSSKVRLMARFLETSQVRQAAGTGILPPEALWGLSGLDVWLAIVDLRPFPEICNLGQIKASEIRIKKRKISSEVHYFLTCLLLPWIQGSRAEASRGSSLVRKDTPFRIFKELLNVSIFPLSFSFPSLSSFFYFFLFFSLRKPMKNSLMLP